MAQKLTEWFQFYNSLASSSRVICPDQSDVPKWYTSNLKHMKNQLLQEKSVGSPNYNHSRNKYVKAVRKSKKMFSQDAARGVWKILNCRQAQDWNKVIEGSGFSNHEELAEGFANHFRSKIENLNLNPNPSSNASIKCVHEMHPSNASNASLAINRV